MKKSSFIKLAIMALISLFISACQSPAEEKIDSLRDLVEKIDNEGDEMSKEEWDEVLKEYEEITSKDSKDTEYTPEQLEEIGRLKGKFMAKSSKIYAKKFGSKLNDLFKQAGGLLNGFIEGLTEGGEEE